MKNEIKRLENKLTYSQKQLERGDINYTQIEFYIDIQRAALKEYKEIKKQLTDCGETEFVSNLKY